MKWQYSGDIFRWFCHVDDDTYLNVIRLREILSQYDPKQSWYIGRKSTSNKVSILYKNVSVFTSVYYSKESIAFFINWLFDDLLNRRQKVLILQRVVQDFVCRWDWQLGLLLSWSRINFSGVFINSKKYKGHVCLIFKRIDRFMELSDEIGLPDDVLLGFINGSFKFNILHLIRYLRLIKSWLFLEILIGLKLTENNFFHSHLESLSFVNADNLKKQVNQLENEQFLYSQLIGIFIFIFEKVSLSYNLERKNFVNLNSVKDDPTKYAWEQNSQFFLKLFSI